METFHDINLLAFSSSLLALFFWEILPYNVVTTTPCSFCPLKFETKQDVVLTTTTVLCVIGWCNYFPSLMCLKYRSEPAK